MVLGDSAEEAKTWTESLAVAVDAFLVEENSIINILILIKLSGAQDK
jgi:hypothetical protein